MSTRTSRERSVRNCLTDEGRLTFTLGYSRMIMAEATVDQKLGTLLRRHEEAFRQLGGVPEEILYDRMKTVWLEIDERGEVVWHPVFLDFARYWGFQPRLCRPYLVDRVLPLQFSPIIGNS